MSDPKISTGFEKIIDPVIVPLKEEADKLRKDAETYRFSLYFFTINLLYAAINDIKSIGLLVTDIKTSPNAKELGLVDVSKSMYSEAFSRYHPVVFRRIFFHLINRMTFLEIPELKSLGRLLCIDGSVFPAFQSMTWAKYQENANAVKLHLAFELNRMLPVQFISTDANSSEKSALLTMLEAGVTYIADRGYVSFAVFHTIAKKDAFFVIRIKAHMKYATQEVLNAYIPSQWHTYVSQVTDRKIRFTNDKHKGIYRLVTFVALGETYFIATNRFDLKAYEVIMLYAYRWQVELFFRCIKRTFNGLHLWSHDPKGVEVHFLIYLIAYVLLLQFKQDCEMQNNDSPDDGAGDEQEDKILPETTHGRRSESRVPPACGVVSLLGGKLKKYWKIGVHWLAAVRNLLFQPVTPSSIKTLCFLKQ